MIEQFKQVLQDFLSPQLEAIRGEIKALSAQLAAQDTKIDGLRREIESVRREIELTRREFLAEIRRIDEKFTAEIRANSAEIKRVEETLSADFTRFEGIADARLISMNEKLEFTRRESLAEIKAAGKGATDRAA